MITLFIGDSDSSAKSAAFAFDSGAALLELSTVDSFFKTKSGTFFTGLCFIQDLDLFSKICQSATEIYYCPPAVWSDSKKGHSEQQKYVEIVLCFASQTIPVHGLDLQNNPYSFLDHDYRHDQRKTDNRQIWITGCSITQGDGVDQEETWKHIVSQRFDMPYSDLSLRGSSIMWQSDQLCQADIRPGDLVFWGLTTHVRLPVIYEPDNSLFHLHAGSYQKPYLREKVKPYPIDLLTNKTLVYHNVMAIRRAVNFCKKAGADITIMALMYDWDLIYNFYCVPQVRQALSWPEEWLDLGTDNIHPGPHQHARIARQFIDFYKKLYS